jgi:tRNA pseudouridine38-40 synthase
MPMTRPTTRADRGSELLVAEPASPPGNGGLVRVRIDLGYDGTEFSGWARQPGLRTVQATLEDALGTVLRLPERASLTVAGRTDAGVHARGQVAHVDLPTARWSAHPNPFRALARALPPDIRVRALTEAPPGFDARFGALSRRYAYRICDQLGGPDPLRRREVLARRRPVDVDLMNAASMALVGLHDFAAFCRFRRGGTTLRELTELRWERDRDRLVVGTVVADAFCHSMVRSIVGALLPVGEGRRSWEWPGQVLLGGVRDPLVQVAAAHGLTLEEVCYPADDELAERAEVTRRPRRGQ